MANLQQLINNYVNPTKIWHHSRQFATVNRVFDLRRRAIGSSHFHREETLPSSHIIPGVSCTIHARVPNHCLGYRRAHPFWRSKWPRWSKYLTHMCTSGHGSEVFGLLCHDSTFLREAKTRQRNRKENGIGETGGIVAKRKPASGAPAPLKIPCKTIEEINFPADIVFSC